MFNTSNSFPNLNLINTDDRSNKSITMLVFWMSIFFIIGHTPYALFIILKNFNEDEEEINFYDYMNDAYLSVLHRVALTTLVIIHSSNIFIYYFFNKLFQSILKAYIKKIIYFIQNLI
jgi:hypothetical protein